MHVCCLLEKNVNKTDQKHCATSSTTGKGVQTRAFSSSFHHQQNIIITLKVLSQTCMNDDWYGQAHVRYPG